MKLNNRGEFEATARVSKENHQWVIRIEDLPDWLMETIKDEAGSGYDPSIEGDIGKPKILVLEARYYPVA